MKKTRILLTVCTVLCLITAGVLTYETYGIRKPLTPNAVSAQNFLEMLYANYHNGETSTFSPYDADAHVFDPAMFALFAEDAKLLNGELGDLDGDVICDCQDFNHLSAKVHIQSATPTEARATVDFHDGDSPAHHNTFTLVQLNGAWLVHDVQEKGQPSLRTYLLKEIARLQTH